MFKLQALVTLFLSLLLTLGQGAVHEFPITKECGVLVNCTKLQDLVADFK